MLLALGVVSLLLACTTKPKAKVDRECQPGAYVFCRCQDRQEGSKLCGDDGQSFGQCEPCESYGNAEGPLEPGDPGFEEPFPEDDAGIGDGGNASCGNGIVEPGEDCDDDNSDETDGCDSSCKLAGKTPFATNACPGLEVHVWGGAHRPTLAESTTVGSGNRRVSPSCTTTATTGAGSADRVFNVTAHKNGTLTVATSDVKFNMFLWAAEACVPNGNTAIACVDAVAGVGAEKLSFPVENGKSYHVFVDGSPNGNGNGPGNDAPREGDFTVTFSIP